MMMLMVQLKQIVPETASVHTGLVFLMEYCRGGHRGGFDTNIY